MRLPPCFFMSLYIFARPKRKSGAPSRLRCEKLAPPTPRPLPFRGASASGPLFPSSPHGGRQSKKSSFCKAERGFFIPKLFISCGVRLDKLLKPCLDPFVCRAQALRRKLKNRFLHIVGTFVANGCVGGNGKGHCGFVRAVPPAKILSAAGINVVGARL